MSDLIRIVDIDRIRAAGLPFRTVDEIRWCFRTAADKGLTDAFVRIGKNIHVDPVKFHELVRQSAR